MEEVHAALLTPRHRERNREIVDREARSEEEKDPAQESLALLKMMPKVDSRKKLGENSGGGKLLNDIEAISKALYLDKNRPRSTFATATASSRSKSVGKTHLPEPKSKIRDDKKDVMDKEKKSIWSWKGLKSFTHARNRRFNCCFSLQVHSIEGLPPLFDDLSLLVHWRRRDGELVTHPVTVFQGVAEFEEQLLHPCSIYGIRNGPHHSAKYEAKHFLVYASVYGTPELDLGKHRVDLTRLLPLTLEELEEEKSSGKWTTSYRLSGKARGAILNVSYRYEIIDGNKTENVNEKDVSFMRSSRQNSESTVKLLRQVDHDNELSTIHRAGSLPTRSTTSQRSSEDVKDLHEVLPIKKSELSDSINLLYKKFEGEKLNSLIEPVKTKDDIFLKPIEPIKPDLHFSSDADKKNAKDECDVAEFSIKEVPTGELEKSLEDTGFTAGGCAGGSHADIIAMASEGITDKENAKDEYDIAEFSTKEEGAEVPTGELEKSTEDTGFTADGSAGGTHARDDIIANVSEGKAHDLSVVEGPEDEPLISDSKFSEAEVYNKEPLVKELDSTLSSITDLVKEELESHVDDSDPSNGENHMELKADYGTPKKGNSLNFDDATDVVASEFLELLGIEHSPFGSSSESEPESPRERLLRQFEEDALASGSSLFNFIDEDGYDMAYGATTESAFGLFSQDYYPPSVQTSQELPKIEPELMRHKAKASMLEGLETEALMHEWGLNEKAFQCSPPSSSGGFGSPIDMPSEIHDQLPSLGEGLGPFLQTKNGGFLRSMNPVLFGNAKSGGSLIMQVSSPVVMPADMGSGVMDILQHLASVGIEKLSMQANKLMPLEDVTGKTMQQIAWEAAPGLEGLERQDLLQHEFGFGDTSGDCGRVKENSSGHRNSKFESNVVGGGKDSEYVSLEDLAPLAMDKVEALSMEGLRIQSGLSDEDAPANISPQSIGEFSALEGKRVSADGSLGLEGAGGLQLLDIKDNGEDVDGLMALSLTLDEWMKLDSGEIYDGDHISERTSKLLAAHHATSMDLIRGRSKGEKRRGKGKNCGLLGNNFTVALMVQLRDPLRNYEPVGTPMLALIQVERVFVPPKPRIYCTVSELRNNNDGDDEPEPSKTETNEQPKDEIVPEEKHIAQFKITEVHVAGLKTEPGKKKLWGTSAQQQSGSRWLLANGMGKKNKHPLMKSKNGAKSSVPASSSETTTVQPGETLWSISSHVHGTGAKSKELAAPNSRTRNPNVIFPKIRLR